MKPIYQYHEKHVFIDLSLLENYAKEKENIKSTLVDDLSSCPSKLKRNRDTGWTEDSAAQDASCPCRILEFDPQDLPKSSYNYLLLQFLGIGYPILASWIILI